MFVCHLNFRPHIIRRHLSRDRPTAKTIVVVFIGSRLDYFFVIRTAKTIKKTINPCPAVLVVLYFSLFEAGIANAISSFK